MTTLADWQISSMGTDLIDPFDPDRVQPASYDLLLGEEFIVFDAHEQVCIDLETRKDESPRRVIRTFEQGFVLHPGEFVLGCTFETIKLPDDMIARLDGKSTIGRLGLLIHVTAGFVDPGWHGPLTLEIYNVRKVPIILRPMLPFCQLSFSFMEKVNMPYEGKYQNSTGVEPSKAVT
jgi:dCTP deaminase